jgi:hypothetical protein
LSNDARFDGIRQVKSSNGRGHIIEVPIKRGDNRWLRQTNIIKSISQEKGELQKLVTDVENRVQARREGIASILKIFQ